MRLFNFRWKTETCICCSVVPIVPQWYQIDYCIQKNVVLNPAFSQAWFFSWLSVFFIKRRWFLSSLPFWRCLALARVQARASSRGRTSSTCSQRFDLIKYIKGRMTSFTHFTNLLIFSTRGTAVVFPIKYKYNDKTTLFIFLPKNIQPRDMFVYLSDIGVFIFCALSLW